ncbi:hypothetical protein ACFQDF_32765 [Ectobacillus funiculus]|uniref:Uncharacterized protein n=1 Tax=Ectobacillus funiculus TaxID=137993 RepID=A0ABV5WJR3_9BACI
MKCIPVDELPYLKLVVLIGENVKEEGLYTDFKKRMETASDQLTVEWVD